jgi:hypothetical protein
MNFSSCMWKSSLQKDRGCDAQTIGCALLAPVLRGEKSAEKRSPHQQACGNKKS